MEKILEALVEELVSRLVQSPTFAEALAVTVAKKIAENTDNMDAMLKRTVKAEDIDGLEDFVKDYVSDALEGVDIEVDARLRT